MNEQTDDKDLIVSPEDGSAENDSGTSADALADIAGDLRETARRTLGTLQIQERAELEADFTDLLQLRMGGKDFLLPAGEATEIVRPMPLTPVPMAPDHLLGVGNVHGQIVCVLEPGKLMSLPVRPGLDDDATRYVMLRHGRMRVALRVDAVPATHRIREAALLDIEALEAVVPGLRGSLDVGGVRFDVLDAASLLQE